MMMLMVVSIIDQEYIDRGAPVLSIDENGSSRRDLPAYIFSKCIDYQAKIPFIWEANES